MTYTLPSDLKSLRDTMIQYHAKCRDSDRRHSQFQARTQKDREFYRGRAMAHDQMIDFWRTAIIESETKLKELLSSNSAQRIADIFLEAARLRHRPPNDNFSLSELSSGRDELIKRQADIHPDDPESDIFDFAFELIDIAERDY